MILSNAEIVRCLDEGLFSIDNLAGHDPTQPPFNTSAVDLRLAKEIHVPEENVPAQIDIRREVLLGIYNSIPPGISLQTFSPLRFNHERWYWDKHLKR